MSGHDYWSDFNRGVAGLPPREGMFYNMAERAGRDSTLPNNNTGPAGSGIAALFLLVAAVAAVVVLAATAAASALLAVPCGYLLILITALFTGGHRPDFGDAYKASFIGLVATAVLAGLIAFLTLEGILPPLPLTAPAILWLAEGLGLIAFEPGAALSGTLVAQVLGGVVLMLPGIIIFAVLLGRRIGDPYTGGLGLLRGIAAGFVVLVVPILGAAAAVKFAAAYAEPMLRANEITTYLAVTLGLMAIMAIAGGLILGLALMAAGGGLTKGGPLFRTAWFTGAIAMAIAGGTAALAILLFRDGDAMLQALISMSGVGMKNPPTFTEALPGFLKLTTPGAVAGGAFVAGSLYAYRGLFGWLKALLITVPFCLAALGGTVMVLAQLR